MDIIKFFYSFDVSIVRLRKILKQILPAGLVKLVKGVSNAKLSDPLSLADNTCPWTSPNVWHEIISFYSKLENPTVVEFGTGASTMNHIQAMMGLERSSYVGIENNPTWFWLVVASLLRRVNRNGFKPDVKLKYQVQKEGSEDLDVEVLTENMSILLRLRTSPGGYREAFDKACDVVIVDGILRKQCIDEILNTTYLRQGGLLMLMEAGRGSESWWEGKLHGEDDYSVELKTMLSLGGTLLNGNGLDNWPDCKRKSPRPVSYYYPMEACKLILPYRKTT